jgi:transcription elongation GreA/GreB family factor
MSMAARTGMLYEPRRTPRRAPVSAVQAIITRDRERALRDELSRLRRELEVEYATRLEEARSFGDSGENDDYLQIKEEEAVIASRILRLEAVLHGAEVAGAPTHANGRIGLGTTAEVEDMASGEVREHRLVGGYEPLDRGDVSANSPIGRALLGRSAGDQVLAVLPNGTERGLRIAAVRSSGRR